MKSRTHKALSLVSGTVIAAGVFLLPRTAGATVGADLDWAFPISSNADKGWGFGLRLGKELDVPLVTLTPELGFSYYNFGGTFGNTMYIGRAGVRLALFELIRPGAFAHIGFAASDPDIGSTRWGAEYDFGLFLDFTAIPVVNLGIHAAYNGLTVGTLSSSDSSRWLTLGLHADFSF